MALVLDIGGSYIKAGLFENNQLTQVIHKEFPDFLDMSGSYREVDPGILLSTVMDVLSNYQEHRDILVSTQMHGSVLVDEKLDPLTPIISWQDTRCLEDGRFKQVQEILGEEVIRDLGNELRPGLPITTLYSLKEKGGHYLCVGDYILSKLFDIEDLPIHVTNAAATGLYSFSQRNWHFEAIKELGLEDVIWPEIQHDIKTRDLNPSMGDQQVALYGAGLKEGQLSLNIATGSQVSLVTASNEFGDYQLRPYFNNNYLRTITHIPAGRALNGFIKFLAPLVDGDVQKVWSIVVDKTKNLSKSSIKASISIFPTEFGNLGGLESLSENNLDIGELFIALYESMAENYFISAEKLLDSPIRASLLFSGGLVTKNSKLREILIKKFKSKKNMMSPNSEDVLIGLGLLFQDSLLKKTEL